MTSCLGNKQRLASQADTVDTRDLACAVSSDKNHSIAAVRPRVADDEGLNVLRCPPDILGTIACRTSQPLLSDLSENGQVSRAELSSLVELQHDHYSAGQRSLRVHTAKCTKQSTHASFFAFFCGVLDIQVPPWMTCVVDRTLQSSYQLY